MEGRIGHLHLRYRVAAHGGQSPVAPPSVSRGRLAEAVGQALDALLEGDERVIVLRAAHIQLVLNAGAPVLDRRIVRAVAGQVADRVARTIAESGDGNEVARFENQSHFVASFLSALVRGWAWERWFFGAFHSHRHAGVRETILAVLAANRSLLPRILAYLRRADSLEAVLASLGALDSRALRGNDPEEPVAPNQAFRPLADAGFRLLAALGWWIRDPLREQALLDRFLATRPLAPNWHDPASLSAGVLDLIRYVLREGSLAPEPDADGSAESRVSELLTGELDWLDRGWVEAEIAALRTTAPPAPAVGVPWAGTPTPHQRELLLRIRQLIDQGDCVLDRAAPASAANVLRILAALDQRWPELTASDTTVGLIERVLEAWALIRGLKSTPSAREEKEEAGDAGTASSLPDELDPGRARARDALRALGPAATDLLDTLEGKTGAAEPAGALGEVTWAAGLFLMARPLLDLRLAGVAREADVPLTGLLAGIAVGLFGHDVLHGDRLDPAVASWASLDPETSPADLVAAIAAISPEGLRRLQRGLLRTLIGQRHLDRAAMAVTQVSAGDGIWWLAGDVAGLCWPLALHAEDEPDLPTMALFEAWSEAAGQPPALSPCERGIASDLASLLGAGILPDPLAVPLASIISGVVRAWARWLPGVGSSSLPFLLRNCIHRAGRVRVTATTLEVELEPAPLDVVLEMAGCFRPVEEVLWMGGRSLRLAVHRRPLGA